MHWRSEGVVWEREEARRRDGTVVIGHLLIINIRSGHPAKKSKDQYEWDDTAVIQLGGPGHLQASASLCTPLVVLVCFVCFTSIVCFTCIIIHVFY